MKIINFSKSKKGWIIFEQYKRWGEGGRKTTVKELDGLDG